MCSNSMNGQITPALGTEVEEISSSLSGDLYYSDMNMLTKTKLCLTRVKWHLCQTEQGLFEPGCSCWALH